MSKIKESLIANEAEILAALPAEFQNDFKEQLKALPSEDPVALSGEDEIQAIKNELKANPAVNESEAADSLKDISAPPAL